MTRNGPELQIVADAVLPDPTGHASPAGIVVRDGRVLRVDPLPSQQRSTATRGRCLVMPALSNAHDHARIVRNSAMGGFDEPLESWLFRLALIPAVDPFLAGIVSMGRMALGGVGSAMVHYTRIQGMTDFPTEARAVISAARRVGLRLAFAVQLRDRHPLVYGASDPILTRLSPDTRREVEARFMRKPLPLAEQLALVDAVATEHADDPCVTVQYGPAGVQWCSHEMLAAIALHSADHNRRVHMHLLETREQRIWADAEFPSGIVHYLDSLGLLNERMSLAHCVWTRPDELDLIAERAATIVINTSSNLAIRSGLAALPEMLRRGCRVAMGLDGLSLDEDEDALRELRLNYALAKGTGYEVAMSQADALAFATANGRFAIDGCTWAGRIEAGTDADLLTIDLDALGSDLLWGDVPVSSLLLARATKSHLRNLYVAGRAVITDGRLAEVDLASAEAEMQGILKHAVPEMAGLRTVVSELASAVGDHYRNHCGCS